MDVVPEMDVDNTQSSFFYLLDSSCEQHLCGLVPSADEGNNVLLLDYERIVIR